MSKTLHRLYIGLFVIVTISSLFLLIHYGWSDYSTLSAEDKQSLSKDSLLYSINAKNYYSLSPENRPYSLKHETLNPSGYLGHAFGIFGTLMLIVGVGAYMLRKRVKMFFHFGFLKHWLEFHIFLCTIGPLFVLFHTEFKFGGIVAVSFWSMTAVVLSGVVGRFIYVQIPRSIEGNELNNTDIDILNKELDNKLVADGHLTPEQTKNIQSLFPPEMETEMSTLDAVSFFIKDFYLFNISLKLILAQVSKYGITDKTLIKHTIRPVIKSKLILRRRIKLLKAMQKLLHHWHIFHLPFAIVMFIIMIIHVIVTITFGYRWIF